MSPGGCGGEGGDVAELVRGSVADRPWGRTLATLGLRGVTGQLTLVSEGKRFLVAFESGAVVAASSPLASDAAVRVALTSHLVSSSQVPEIARRQAAAPERDEIELIAELARLGPDHALRLRRRVIAQRAARTFSQSRGDFIVTDHTELTILPGCALDVRAVIYMGARTNLAEQRLSAELDQLGSWFRLRPALDEDLPQFGFTDLEQPVIERLRGGGTPGQIEEFAASLVDGRTVHAVIYALAVCNACELGPARPSAAPALPPLAAEGTPSTIPRPPSPVRGTSTTRPLPATAERATSPPARLATGTAVMHPIEVGTGEPGSAADADGVRSELVRSRGSAPRRVPRPRQVQRGDTLPSHEVKALIAQRLTLLDHGADHFQLLGVAQDVSPDELRKAYLTLARQLHPDRLTALGIPDDGKHAQRLFAQINAGFAILCDPARRAHYLDVLRRGGDAGVRADEARTEELARRILDAEEAFRRGEQALERDQPRAAVVELERAVRLNPDEADHHALLAWSQFCAAPDKLAIAATTRRQLDQAIQRAPGAVTARFCLGRVERMLGRDQEAVRHFRDVLARSPGHAGAAAELRVIEARRSSDKAGGDKAGGDKPGGGLFGRFRR
jgi:DnaJ-domain-containing protein 1